MLKNCPSRESDETFSESEVVDDDEEEESDDEPEVEYEVDSTEEQEERPPQVVPAHVFSLRTRLHPHLFLVLTFVTWQNSLVLWMRKENSSSVHTKWL
jgi:hypothetical protein